MKKLSKKERLTLSIVRTVGAIVLIILGIFALYIGLGWHKNVLADLPNDIAFIVCAFMDLIGAAFVAGGLYGLSPIFWTVLMSSILEVSEEDTRSLILSLKRKYWW